MLAPVEWVQVFAELNLQVEPVCGNRYQFAEKKFGAQRYHTDERISHYHLPNNTKKSVQSVAGYFGRGLDRAWKFKPPYRQLPYPVIHQINLYLSGFHAASP